MGETVKAGQLIPGTSEALLRSPSSDRAAEPAANEPLPKDVSPWSQAASSQPDWTDWQPPGPAIPPHQLTRVCDACQTLNRDTAQYCRHCARKLLPQSVGEAAVTAPSSDRPAHPAPG